MIHFIHEEMTLLWVTEFPLTILFTTRLTDVQILEFDFVTEIFFWLS